MKKKSLKNQIMIYLVVPLMLCITLLLFYNFYSIHVYNDEIAESSMVMQELYMNNVEKYLHATDSFLTGIVVNNANFTLLRYRATQLQTHLALDNIKEICKVQVNNVNITSGFLIYSMKNNAYRDVYEQKYDFNQRDEIRKFILEFVKGQDNYAPLGWFYTPIGSNDYLVRIIGDKGTYAISFIDFNDIPKPNNNKFINNYEVIFRTANGQVITNQSFVRNNNIEFSDHEDSYYVTGNNSSFILIGSLIKGTNLEMYFVKLNEGFLGSLKAFQIVLLIVSILSFFIIPGSLYRINRIIVKPINQLKEEMEQIKKGDMDTQIDAEYQLEEFGEVNETFNSMILKIKNLKIQYYEQKLEKQKAQMQYLQLQIKPHFYLNCLKNIYGMAQNKKFNKIQELTLAISDHLRYIFKDNSKMVLVSQELSFVKNYITLQEVGVENPPVCIMDVETDAMDIWIPPLIIQTFVENSVKYGRTPDIQLNVKIKVKLLKTEETEYLDIEISDNGKGYPQEVLDHLEQEVLDTYSDEHIGINNVINRLRLLYHDKVEFVFMNTDTGAYSELVIPWKM